MEFLFSLRSLMKYQVEHSNRNSISTLLSPGQTIATFSATYPNIVGRNMLRSFGHPVATCCVLLAQVWSWSNLSQQHPTSCSTSQQGGQTHATCCAQQCCDMLCWNVAIVWPGLKFKSVGETLVCDHLNERIWAVLSCGANYHTVKSCSYFCLASLASDLLEFCVIVGYWLLFHKCSKTT